MANTPERLKKVQELFHAALPLEPAARTVFLVEACGSDRELLDEVQSLISAHEREGSFIDSPAAQPVAEMLATMYAGAARLVVSLSSVNDKATADLMTKFYQKLLKQGERPAAALRAAQVEMWKQKQWQSPYYWAAFTLQGEWR